MCGKTIALFSAKYFHYCLLNDEISCKFIFPIRSEPVTFSRVFPSRKVKFVEKEETEMKIFKKENKNCTLTCGACPLTTVVWKKTSSSTNPKLSCNLVTVPVKTLWEAACCCAPCWA